MKGPLPLHPRVPMHIINHSSLKIASGVAALGISLSVVQKKSFCAAAAAAAEKRTSLTSRPVVYQYKICPFCNRVKSYLDYLKVDYDTVEVNPLTKSEISNLTLKTKKVPVAIIGEKVVEDSSHILDAINESDLTVGLEKKFFPEDTAKWTEWSEKTLSVMLYPNITRSLEESWQCFSYSGDVKSWSPLQRALVRTVGPTAMFFANGKIKKKYGIVDERKELQSVLDVWCDAIGDKKFLHGDFVTMPDIMVFGVLHSIDGLRAFDDIMQDNPLLKSWYDRVAALAPSHEIATN